MRPGNSVSVQGNIDESGISPSRFQTDLENEQPGESLRMQQPSPAVNSLLNPANLANQSSVGGIGGGIEIPVMSLLNNRDCFDIKSIEAERLFLEQNYQKAYEIIKNMIEEDFYYLNIVPLYCSILNELNKVGELYYLAHKLVSANNDLAISWFAVGSYYFLIKKYDLARKYFNKANRIDKQFAASWIAFGHSFAAQDESDQAMAAYRTANRLFPGCHQAVLYIGMEYLRTNNLSTALMSFNEAKKINDRDPMVHNEIGAVYYKQGKFD
jgi:anaphase-promoting complex subunit 6